LRKECQHNQSALARFLAAHPAVERVYIRGLGERPRSRRRAPPVFRLRWGAQLLRGDLERTVRFVDATRIPSIGPSMGGVE
jgi:cystathionine beta-lyase/cystathionine gamma-synthase